MKAIVVVVVLVLSLGKLQAQDSLQLRQIDALVAKINSSPLPVKRDTIVQNRSEMGLKMTTYITSLVTKGELKKYVNHIKSSVSANNMKRDITSENAFYFDHNHLIKVEEYVIEAGAKQALYWYYANDKPLYYNLQNAKGDERATLLLGMAKTILKEMTR